MFPHPNPSPASGRGASRSRGRGFKRAVEGLHANADAFGHAAQVSRTISIVGAVAGALAVALGAFGAHALRASLDVAASQTWHTAVEYQFWHALALLAAASAPPSRLRAAAAVLFAAGIILFCSSLYALALGAPRSIGTVTPFGGLAFIAGWLVLAAAFWRTAKQ